MKCFYITFIAAALMLTGSGCAVTTDIVAEPQAPHGVHEQSARITEAAIEDDLAYINSLRKRLEILNASGIPLESYHMCKAQAWTDMAFDEYTDNDRSEVVAAALEQAETIITGLEQGTEVGMDTPVIATSTYLRPDLWAAAEAAKKGPSFECTACDVARLEVQIVWIGHETNELGWRHAESEIMAAERLERGIRKSAADCQGVEETQLYLPDRIHFAFDSSSISAQSAAVLDRIAEHVLNGDITRLQLQGHADEIGGDDYNLALSRRRAEAVREYLLARGISPDRLTLRALGELMPARNGHTREARAYNRRVELLLITPKYIDVENLDQDLQP